MANQADDRMYEAPDRYKRMISARLPDGESLGVTSREPDEGSSPLRDAVLKMAPGNARVVSQGGAHTIVYLVARETAGRSSDPATRSRDDRDARDHRSRLFVVANLDSQSA